MPLVLAASAQASRTGENGTLPERDRFAGQTIAAATAAGAAARRNVPADIHSVGQHLPAECILPAVCHVRERTERGRCRLHLLGRPAFHRFGDTLVWYGLLCPKVMCIRFQDHVTISSSAHRISLIQFFNLFSDVCFHRRVF